VPGSDGGSPAGDVGGAALARATPEALAAASRIAAEVEAGFATEYTEEQEVDIYRAMALPGVVCNSCSLQERCPKMQPNATCAYTEDMQGLTTRDIRNVLPRLEMLADLQTERALRGALAERVMGGGTLDPAVSRQIEIAAAAAERVARIKAADRGTQTMTVVAQGPGALGKGGGILSKLMAGIGAPQTGRGEIVLNPEEAAGDGKVHLPQLVEAPKAEQEKLTVTMTNSPADLPPRIA
jgi:hypothetical protein